MRLGEWDLNTEKDCQFEIYCSDPVLDVPVAQIIPHETYLPKSKENDIALIRLSTSVKYTKWINPICLPFGENVRKVQLDEAGFIASGWGKTENCKLIEFICEFGLKFATECEIRMFKLCLLLQ